MINTAWLFAMMIRCLDKLWLCLINVFRLLEKTVVEPIRNWINVVGPKAKLNKLDSKLDKQWLGVKQNWINCGWV